MARGFKNTHYFPKGSGLGSQHPYQMSYNFSSRGPKSSGFLRPLKAHKWTQARTHSHNSFIHKKRRCSVNIHWYELGKQEHHKGNIQSKGESPAVADWNRQVLEINNSSIWAKIFKPEGNISRWEIHYENQNSLRLSSFHRILSMQ